MNDSKAIAMGGYRTFKCRCHNCGKWRHRRAKYPFKNSNSYQNLNQNTNSQNQNTQKAQPTMPTDDNTNK